MVDFSIQSIMEMIAQLVTGGDVQLAGLLVLMAAVFITMGIMGAMRAPIEYSIVPMFPLAILFGAMGVISTEVSFLLIIFSGILIALQVRKMVAGE